MARGLKFVRAMRPRFDPCGLPHLIQTHKNMKYNKPRTRKQFRKLQQLKRDRKALEAAMPNKQVGKWSDIGKMMAKARNNDQHTGASALVGSA